MLKKFYDKSLFSVHSSVGTISLWSLAAPLMFENIMNRLQGIVNTAVLSGYSETAVGAVGAANSVISVILLLGTVIATGATVVISNFIGAEDIKKARETSYTLMLSAILLSVVLTPLLLVYSKTIMTLLNLKGETFSYAISYFNIRVIFISFSVITSSILAIMKCYGYPKYTFLIGLLTNVLNLILNIYVIYFPQYAPITGVRGVAYSCCISNVIGLFVAIFILKKLKIQMSCPESVHNILSYTKRIMSIGIPSGVSSATFAFSQMITTAFVAQIGDNALTAKFYFENILGFVYLFSSGAGNANALLIGRRYGAKEFEEAEKMNRQLTNITIPVNFMLSAIVVLLHRPLMHIFTSNEAIISLAIGVFAVDILVEQARAVSQVYEYALRATGDVLFFMIILTISCFVCSIGLAYFLSITCKLGLVGCWLGLAADEGIRAIASYLRWKSGRWKSLKA